jgi:hypothetical protein
MELRKKAISGNEEGGRKERQHESGAARGKMEKRTKRERKKDARGKADSNVEFADKERGRI